MDYKRTMNLPVTEFPMRANLASREMEWVRYWAEIDLHARALEMNQHGEPFVLHDGPPYANGHIHMGTAFNKVLKDLIVRYKTMRGFRSPYVPGWDCHGQPIEHQVEKDLGPERMTVVSQAELREACRAYAMKYVRIQSEEFQRLGVVGDFENPYLTLDPAYEAGNVRVFKEMYSRGLIYRGSKPIHWCIRCHTALAEAELEYREETSPSIYVSFTLTSDSPWAGQGPLGILVWTTTPWTLPANVAVTCAPDASYVGVRKGDHIYIVAAQLVESVAAAAKWPEGSWHVLGGSAKGSQLSGLTYAHPIHAGVEGVLVVGDHVDMTTGTGAVHTAPGHGEEDYLVASRCGLPIPMPVDGHGVFDAGGGPFSGMSVQEANPHIVAWLAEHGLLISSSSIDHSYPHCWRCKRPVIYRATEQWFVRMDGESSKGRSLRQSALDAIERVEWIPGWSVKRISGMVAERPDWCISRQRAWGVPIPVFTCLSCGETVATDDTFDAVIALFEREGADAWFVKDPAEYLPEGVTCAHCGGTSVAPEDDILDVWWESGVSHASVLDTRMGLHRPAELYLEGSDQHRGWFQSALLTSVGAYDAAPFERVLTHGFIVDGDGRKMSKSLGNVVSPNDVVTASGADIIRLWVASADYSQDVSVSSEILDRTSEAYRRIRNTFRFILSNLGDFSPDHAVPWSEMREVDRWALVRLAGLAERVTVAYDAWRFHQVYHAIYSYCVTDLSSFYLDLVKDRLYSDARDSVSRRSAQTALWAIHIDLVRLVAPILAFSAEEVWQFTPLTLRGEKQSVHLAGWPARKVPVTEAELLESAYQHVLEVRDVVTKELEAARNERMIGKSQEAAVTIVAPPSVAAVLRERGTEALADMLIVASVRVLESDESEPVAVRVERALLEKCPRCWNHRELLPDAGYGRVCDRCAEVVEALSSEW